jgi:hypothetical protein
LELDLERLARLEAAFQLASKRLHPVLSVLAIPSSTPSTDVFELAKNGQSEERRHGEST